MKKTLRLELPPLVHGWDIMPRWEKLHGGNPCGRSEFVTRNRTMVEQRLILKMTYRQMAEYWGISKERCRQIVSKTLVAFWSAMEQENERWERINEAHSRTSIH